MTSASDIRKEYWLLRLAPAAVRSYLLLMRADRPIGTWLLLLPSCWSIVLAGGRQIEWLLLLLFAIGAFVMRGAGCTINDLWDRDVDAKVARTAGRPLPSGQVTPRQALVFLAALLAFGLAILLSLNDAAKIWGAASLALVITYPLMKRITYWPQAFLGLTFNWGALLGWIAVTGEIALAPLLLYAGGVFWTLGYDTIYAHQDRDDDALVGVKSTALLFGEKTKRFVALFYLLALFLWAAALWQAEIAWPAFIGLAGVALHFFWQITTLRIDEPAACLKRFKSNRDLGLIFFLGLLAGVLAL